MMTEQQLQAYVAWVNSQLKKKPGTRVIEDLRCDMQDGVALADLIHIVAGEQLESIQVAPSNAMEMRANVDQVLSFMTARRIRMHHTTSKDIVEGNLKSIMRLILALAAHFKPSSVKAQASAMALPSYDASPRSHPSIAGIAQGAAAAIADARREAATVSHRPKRPRQLSQDPRFHGSSSDSDRGQFRTLRSQDREELEGASSGSSPRSSTASSPHLQRRSHLDTAGVPKSKSQDFQPGHNEPARLEGDVEEELAASSAALRELQHEHTQLSDEMIHTKRALLKLQDLLLSGQPPDGQEAEECMPCEGSTPDEQIVVLQSKLLQSEEVCKELREELSRVKNECMQLQGTKAAFQQRLSEQDESLIKMKAELLRVGFAQQSLETEKRDLEKQVSDKDRLSSDLRREILHRDRQVEDLMSSLQLQQQEKDNATRTLRAQITDLHSKLKRVGDTEATLSARVASQDRKMARLEGKILQTQPYDTASSSRPSSARSAHSTGSEDIQVVRESLQSLRTSFPGNDPNHHAIDALEQSIASLMDRLHLSEQTSRFIQAPPSDSSTSSSRGRLNYDSTGDFRRSPITALHGASVNHQSYDGYDGYEGFPVQRLDQAPGSSSPPTKVLYFTDRTVTPFMCTLPKRLGEITLRDFKSIFDRQGNYRYHFKAMDPEFGTVKEEITHDDDIIPGWEGKIVAWIEEDHG